MAPPSKVPIYPRPVSPLNAESFYIEPQDVIYGTSQPSSDDDSSARAAKRRRIEKLGEQYLRGDGLHILSAGLKGPFDSSWKNPWANRRRGSKQATAEIPETVGKPLKKLQGQKDGRAKVGNDKVEEWLRRNTTPSSFHIDDQISPTPLRTKVIEIKDSSPVKATPRTMDDALPGHPRRLESQLVTHKVTDKVVADSGINEHNIEASPRLPEPADRPLQPEVTNDARTKRRAWVSHAANADRAEFAALKSKRRVLEVAPSSTMLSPFEYRRSLEGVQKPKKFEDIADGVLAMNQSMAPPASTEPHTLHAKDDERLEEAEHIPGASNLPNLPQAVTKCTSSAAPMLSTDTSRASEANLPSAQPQSLDVPPPSTNNLEFEEQAREQFLDSVDIRVEPSRNLISDETKAVRATKRIDNHENLGSREKSTPHLAEKVLDGAEKTRLPKTITKEGPSTQDMLAGMSPLTFSTVKRPTVGFQQPGTPLTATKQRTEKSGKIASLAPGERFSSGSSQGSLKASLRVTKGNSTIIVGKENKLSGVGAGGSSESLFDCFPKPTTGSSTPVASPKRLKSVLKPAGPPNQTGPFPSTKGSTSTGVDGGQNLPVLGDDTFDLDGAIDDLGSYLGTWDAEREASSLGI